MIKKKICLLGFFAVGKTSLVRRFVHETFDEKYHTTIGVKIDKKEIEHDNKILQLLIWDIHGEDRFQKVQKSYLLGASGYFLVVDATRKESKEAIKTLNDLVFETLGELPKIILINKTDLTDQVELFKTDLMDDGFSEEDIIETSAKTGLGVEEAFVSLVKKLK